MLNKFHHHPLDNVNLRCIPQILFKCSILMAVEIALQVNLLVFVGGQMGFSSAFNGLQYQTVPFNIISFIFKLLS